MSTQKVWFRCPRCWVDMGSPVLGNDHARTCLFCGKHWLDPSASELPAVQRAPIDWPERFGGST